jgi:hypothetical protein
MTDESQVRRGDRRDGDRRKRDRRKSDRRAPVPFWRQPWAFVAYGVLGALLLFVALGALEDEEEAPIAGEVRTAPVAPAVNTGVPAGADLPVENAYTAADYARLVAEGSAAMGQRVRTELFCAPIRSVALSEVDQVNRAVAELVDAGGRVPAAECKWGRTSDAGGQDFLLLVPPELAERFAAAPEVVQGFVRRQRVRAEVEWIGRSDALALRTVGVLRSFLAES